MNINKIDSIFDNMIKDVDFLKHLSYLVYRK